MKHNILGILLIATAIVFPAVAAAQLHEHISVEGKYVPDVIRIDRINRFPEKQALDLGIRPLAYEMAGVVSAFGPSPLVMPATAWNASREIHDNPGYLDLGAGSWLNSTLSAGYRFIDDGTSLLGIRLQHNSSSLWKPFHGLDVKQQRFDESVGIFGAVFFDGWGTLDAAADYHLGRFNYFGMPVSGENVSDPEQTLNDFALRLKWRADAMPGSLFWGIGARMRHFGYRSLFIPGEDSRLRGSRETDISLDGNVRMPWDGNSSIGLDAILDVSVFSGFKTVSDYSVLTLKPNYKLNNGNLQATAGVDLDLAFNAGPKGDRFPFLHISPDFSAAIQKGQIGLYAALTGGTEINTLARRHELDYYDIPVLLTTRPSFTPADASVGLNLGPFSGFSIGIEGRYKVTKNTPLNAGYMASPAMPHYGVDTPGAAGPEGQLNPEGLDLHGFSLAGSLGFDYGQLFSVVIKGTMQRQDGKRGVFNGYDRPQSTLDVEADLSPMERLNVKASFNWRGKRCCYSRERDVFVDSDGIIVVPDSEPVCTQLPDFSTLNLGASWKFSRGLSVWTDISNILNRRNWILPGQPAQGIGFAVGLSAAF